MSLWSAGNIRLALGCFLGFVDAIFPTVAFGENVGCGFGTAVLDDKSRSVVGLKLSSGMRISSSLFR